MPDIVEQLTGVLPVDRVLSGDRIAEDYTHDECLTAPAVTPAVVVCPESTEEVAEVLRFARPRADPGDRSWLGHGPVGCGDPARPTRSWCRSSA